MAINTYKLYLTVILHYVTYISRLGFVQHNLKIKYNYVQFTKVQYKDTIKIQSICLN